MLKSGQFDILLTEIILHKYKLENPIFLLQAIFAYLLL